MINIIDYEMGNLRSVEKAFEKLGFAARVSADPRDIASADKVVLPGVGAFRDCIGNLRAGGFVEPLLAHVAAGKPLLGICVGMQMLFDESEEFGRHQGLGLIPGKVRRFPAGMEEEGERLKVPHMGWNTLHLQQDSPLLQRHRGGELRLLRPLLLLRRREPARRGGQLPLRRGRVLRLGLARQHPGDPVPPGEEPGDRPADFPEFRQPVMV